MHIWRETTQHSTPFAQDSQGSGKRPNEKVNLIQPGCELCLLCLGLQNFCRMPTIAPWHQSRRNRIRCVHGSRQSKLETRYSQALFIRQIFTTAASCNLQGEHMFDCNGISSLRLGLSIHCLQALAVMRLECFYNESSEKAGSFAKADHLHCRIRAMHQLVYNALIRIWVGRFAPSGGLYALLSDDNQIRPMNSSKYHILFPIGETFASWSIQQCIRYYSFTAPKQTYTLSVPMSSVRAALFLAHLFILVPFLMQPILISFPVHRLS
jgi:hypothetical protein